MAFPARILIVGRIRSLTADGNNSTISNDATHYKEHLAFIFPSAVAKLANCAQKTDVPLETGDLLECKGKADAYVAGELPASWSIKQTDLIAGHAWREGAWVPTGGLGLQFEPRAFCLYFPNNATIYSDYTYAYDPNNPARNQRLTIEYFVMVQPMVIP